MSNTNNNQQQRVMRYAVLAATILGQASLVSAFQSPAKTTSSPFNYQQNTKTALRVAVDPTTVTKKDYEDICGVSFDDESLHKRLKATNYLYPKHVEVIEDIAPIAGEMVDEIVSTTRKVIA